MKSIYPIPKLPKMLKEEKKDSEKKTTESVDGRHNLYITEKGVMLRQKSPEIQEKRKSRKSAFEMKRRQSNFCS